MKMLWILFLFLFSRSCADLCSYEKCPEYNKDMLNVHIVCHTHDDAGWLKTVDQYFWGTNQSISKDNVHYILNSITNALLEDPNKKFSYAESGFFSKWWTVQSDFARHNFMKLVKQGQLEFIGGGWVQHDEATTHYAAIIDQMTLGHRFLNTTFGRCGIPKVAWQIDPFGHSRESASLFAQMKLDALFFARIHYLDRDKRRKEKSMEMIWRGSDDIGSESDILTGVFYEHYMPPPGFCFDQGCDDDPIVDDTRAENYNAQRKIDDFLKYVKMQAGNYSTNHIMLTMGGDFHYMNAEAWFTNLDKLIRLVNNRQTKGETVNVFYSTPTCYAQALLNSKASFPKKTDDFFPYANDVHSYWTGYFSSRPTFKGFVRSTSNLFQVCQSLDALALLDPLDWGDVDVLHRALGILQHHDGVSGTAKQHVTNDYSKLLYEGIQECQQVANDAMKYLSSTTKELPPYNSLCTLSNETVCNVSQSADSFLLTVHNGLSKEYMTVVRVPVNHDSYKVLDPNGEEVEAQVDEVPRDPQICRPSQASHELIFPVDLPAFGYHTYYVKKDTRDSQAPKDKQPIRKQFSPAFNEPDQKCSDCSIENEYLIVKFDQTTGLMSSVMDKRYKREMPISQNFYWYRGVDASVEKNQPSGAYIFRPNGTRPNVINDDNVKLEKITGPYVQEMRQTFSEWVSQRVRLIQKKAYVEFEWTVGPIPFRDNISREIISRFDTRIQNNGFFYTDSNGRQIISRKRNFAPTYKYNNSEPISANYYPVNTRIFINDSNVQLTILTDRSQGGSSINDGSVELMVHRRLLQDDWFGVNEPLNETGENGLGLVARGKHWLLIDKPSLADRKHRFAAMEMFYQPILTFAVTQDSFESYARKFKTTFSGLTKPLPQNLHILTVAQWRGTDLLLRVEHIFQDDEDHEFSRPVNISLANLFTTFRIKSLNEVTLSASQYFADQSSSWSSISETKNIYRMENGDFVITLRPMEIRSFICQVKIARRNRCSTNRIRDCVKP